VELRRQVLARLTGPAVRAVGVGSALNEVVLGGAARLAGNRRVVDASPAEREHATADLSASAITRLGAVDGGVVGAAGGRARKAGGRRSAADLAVSAIVRPEARRACVGRARIS